MVTDWVRLRLAEGVRSVVAGDRPPPARHGERADEGFFGPASVTWRVHGDSSMLVGGLRALFLQTMHPLAMAGVADHSAFREDPMDRLWRTSLYVGTTTYGTTVEARHAIATVRRVHEHVTGIAPDGRPYAANDPHLLLWVHHTLVDSFLRAYQRYGAGGLDACEADTYVEEMAVLATEIGAEPAATSVAELRAWFQAERPELHATRAARDTARFLAAAPVPLISWPAYAVIASAAVGLLPRSVRRALWLPTLPVVDPLVVRPAAWTLIRALDWVMGAFADQAA
jgi:uncharacterized protein (DUF2236 family)